MNKIPCSDEEDDIESLRIAALQSLKKNHEFTEISPGYYRSNFRAPKGSRSKWGRFGSQGRVAKSSHFNTRIRSTNLISITPVSDEPVDSNIETQFNLPQAKSEEYGEPVAMKEGSDKFKRYDKSDKSESESEEETEIEDDSPGKLKKSDSLEALMQELDAEIQGKPKTNKDSGTSDVENPKGKKLKKKRKASEKSFTDSQSAIDQLDQSVEALSEDVNNASVDNNKMAPIGVDQDTLVHSEHNFLNTDATSSLIRKRPRSRSPFNRIPFYKRQNQRYYPKIPPPSHLPFNPVGNFQHQMLPFMNPQPNPLFVQSSFNMPPQFSSYFDRPLSPLAINTESLTTATRAPLSPRSAAFVLQNKAIIEKRRRSPRRSYSRSPSRSLSRSPRRSLTPPRRSLSPPRRFRRSVSPRRSSRSPRRFSPRKRSLSPRQRSVSPRRKAPLRNIRGRPMHNRLGLKSDKPVENKDKPKEKETKEKETKEKETKEKEAKEKEAKEVATEEPLDPVLAARKKKFESNELNKKEGIIRLKPKEEKSDVTNIHEPTTVPKVSKPVDSVTSCVAISKPVEREETTETQKEIKTLSNQPTDKKPDNESKDPEEFKELERLLNDENALEDFLLDHKVADIFSDEESASDNEGRFKAKGKHGQKVPVPSFSTLVNGVKHEIKAESLPDSSRNIRGRDRNRYNEKRTRPSQVKETEQEKERAIKPMERQTMRQKITLESDKNTTRAVEKRQERKIEIKIKHPSKYEKIGKIKLNKPESDSSKQKIVIPVQDEISDNSDNEDFIIEDSNDSGDEDDAVLTQGDLRTQLSRKRAEKLHKLPSDQVSSRILQYALHGALLKKSKKKSKRKSLSKVSELKLPIHFRLGLTNPEDIPEEMKVKKKKKRKTRELIEQVTFDDFVKPTAPTVLSLKLFAVHF